MRLLAGQGGGTGGGGGFGSCCGMISVISLISVLLSLRMAHCYYVRNRSVMDGARSPQYQYRNRGRWCNTDPVAPWSTRSMSTYSPTVQKYSPSAHSVRNSKEDALSDREFELLVEGTYRMGEYYDLEARLIIFLAGRLGLRVGEIIHMRESWIDWRRQMISIPEYEPCQKGRDGGVCGYCRQGVRQMAAVRTDWRLDEIYSEPLHVFEPGHHVTPEVVVTEAEMLDQMWSVKTPAAAREVPFDASPRAAIVLERYFDRFDRFQTSKSGVNRRLNRAAEHSEDLTPGDVRPHGLRSTAASYWAGRGLATIPLQSMFGWVKLETAERYVANSGERTARAVRNL